MLRKRPTWCSGRGASDAAPNRKGNNRPQLKNKIAVITGGSSGIGLATAKRFVEEGAYVFIAGRRQAEIDKAVAEIGSNVTGVKTDISTNPSGDKPGSSSLVVEFGRQTGLELCRKCRWNTLDTPER
jgi:hypothetical protein